MAVDVSCRRTWWRLQSSDSFAQRNFEWTAFEVGKDSIA